MRREASQVGHMGVCSTESALPEEMCFEVYRMPAVNKSQGDIKVYTFLLRSFTERITLVGAMKTRTKTEPKVYIGAKVPVSLAAKLKQKALRDRRSAARVIEMALCRELAAE